MSIFERRQGIDQGKKFELPSLRPGLQALLVPSLEAEKFGLKNPNLEIQQLIQTVSELLIEKNSELQTTVALGGVDGGFVGLHIVVRNQDDTPPVENVGNTQRIETVLIESKLAKAWGSRDILGELTEALDTKLQTLPESTELISINAVPSPSGRTIGLVLVIKNS